MTDILYLAGLVLGIVGGATAISLFICWLLGVGKGDCRDVDTSDLSVTWWHWMSLLLAVGLVDAHAAKPAPVNGWIACDTAGKYVALRNDAEDSITLDVPRYPSVVAFLTSSSVSGNLTGKTLTATFYVASSPDVLWTGGKSGGCDVPPNMRLYFTSVPGPYKLMNGWKSPTSYWWSQQAEVGMEVTNLGMTITLSAELDPAQWSDATGHIGSSVPTKFDAAAAGVAQSGFAFGIGCFYDTGVAVSQGGSTIHVLSLNAQ